MIYSSTSRLLIKKLCHLHYSSWLTKQDTIVKLQFLKLFMMPYGSMESQKVMAFVLIHLSAAFDMMDHQILLEFLCKKIGLAGTIMRWFTPYLYDNKCRCV